MIDLKIAGFLMIAYFFVSSKMFNQTFLKKIPGALEYESPTEKGLIIGGFIIAILYLIIGFLVRSDFI